MTLREYICDSTGKPKRGSITRVSEYVGVSLTTVKKWLSGEWQPGVESCRKIQDMIQQRIPMRPVPRNSRVRKPQPAIDLQP